MLACARVIKNKNPAWTCCGAVYRSSHHNEAGVLLAMLAYICILHAWAQGFRFRVHAHP